MTVTVIVNNILNIIDAFGKQFKSIRELSIFHFENTLIPSRSEKIIML